MTRKVVTSKIELLGLGAAVALGIPSHIVLDVQHEPTSPCWTGVSWQVRESMVTNVTVPGD